jgi:hypothetical protein
MAYSVKANKVTILELDIEEIRSLLAERSQAILGQVETGYDRKFEMEPLFVVDHGEATLTGLRIVVTDSLNDASHHSAPPLA